MIKTILSSIIFFSFICLVYTASAGTFGYASNGASSANFENIIHGSYYTCPEDCTVDNISMYIACWTTQKNAKVLIYEYVANDDVGNLVGESDVILLPISLSWTVFPFSSTVVLSAGTIYYLMGWSASGDGLCNVRYDSGTSDRIYANHIYDGTPNPLTGESRAASQNVSIYVTYTPVTNVVPVLSGESPVNESTGVSVDPDLYVLLMDGNGDTMNCTWHTNASGQWIQFASNSSIGNNTNITQSYVNFKGYSTTYWWSVNVSDGMEGYTNETYSFTTIAQGSGSDIWIGEGQIQGVSSTIGLAGGAIMLSMIGILFFIKRRRE